MTRTTLLLVVFLAGPAIGLGHSQEQASFPLAEVKASGTKRFTSVDLVKVGGLTIGQAATAADFEAAAKRMAATGLFKRVAFSYAGTPDRKWLLTFEIEDFDWNVPVLFDNFIWFTDEQVGSALREAVPSFAGSVPATPEITSLITRTLQQLLTARGIPGRVDFLPEGDLRALKGYLFRVVDPAPPVCVWTFNGAARIPPKDLESEMTAAGRAYSKSFVMRRSAGTVLARYRRLGFWKATVGEPVTALSSAAGCDGVSVAMTVNEGEQYKFKGAEWIGNQVMSTGDLNKALALKLGDDSGVAAIEDGLRRITDGYSARGYVTATTKYDQHLDDEAHRVTFRFTIDEGPQFKMGAVVFAGAPPALAAELTQRWRLKAGDVFDASYVAKFQREEISPRVARGARPPSLQMQMNRQATTVDVRFNFGQ